ncbi:hypothetical protein Slin15195_G130830 [Septoria linicola]|uniref:Uncharacterized protein n=1 Tax=Septoria linicola TaxID=215465 RepID=A0A9Q9B2J1_9PEZI|nr:hypothetical protein Slin15195_G130830 [Septoria linicola]
MAVDASDLGAPVALEASKVVLETNGDIFGTVGKGQVREDVEFARCHLGCDIRGTSNPNKSDTAINSQPPSGTVTAILAVTTRSGIAYRQHTVLEWRRYGNASRLHRAPHRAKLKVLVDESLHEYQNKKHSVDDLLSNKPRRCSRPVTLDSTIQKTDSEGARAFHCATAQLQKTLIILEYECQQVLCLWIDSWEWKQMADNADEKVDGPKDEKV